MSSKDDKIGKAAKEELRAAQEFSEWFLGLVEHPWDLTPPLMRELVQKVWVKTDNANIWFREIDGFEDDPDNLTEEKLKDFINSARIEYNKLRNHPPMRTGMYMLTKPKRTKKIDLRFYEDGTSFLNHGYKNGWIVTITGPPGSGKTAFSINYIMPDCVKIGMKVLGNVPLLNMDKVPEYYYSERMSDTLRFICEERLKGNFTCRIYDEVQITHKTVRVASHSYQTQSDIWALERKLGSMTVAILQLEAHLPRELRSLSDLHLHKPSADQRNLVDVHLKRSRKDYYSGVKGGLKREKEIEKMGIFSESPQIDTFGYGLFFVDFNYNDFYSWMVKELSNRKWSEGPISKHQLELTVEYMSNIDKTVDPRTELTDEQRTAAIQEIIRIKKCSVKEAASMFGWGRNKAMYRIKKYSDSN